MQNNITKLTGLFTRNPELRKTGKGRSVVSFGLAVDRDFSSKESTKSEKDFIDCVAWDKTAEYIKEHYAKRSLATVHGRLASHSHRCEDGVSRKIIEVIVQRIYPEDNAVSEKEVFKNEESSGN